LKNYTKEAVIADDSGLVVDALNGEPGVFSSRYCGEEGNDQGNNKKLLSELKDIPLAQRTARFVCCIVFIDEKGFEKSYHGTCEGIIIDTPGMKELGMTDNAEGIKTTFQDIVNISAECKFPDCKHINETGCAVLEALNNGTIDRDSYDNYQKINKEQERFKSTVFEKRKKEKVFGKMLKNYQKDIKRHNDDEGS
jgi:hypothetical protein